MALPQTSTVQSDDVILEVVEKIAAAENVDPLELTPPLYDVVDPDALEKLFDNDRTLGTFTFNYRGYEVSVLSDGCVSVNLR